MSAKQEAKQFGDMLLSKLRHYFDEWFEDETLWMASFMDPRFAFLDTVLSMEAWGDGREAEENKSAFNNG